MDYPVHGILQGRILEWVAFPFSRGSSQPMDQTLVSHTAGEFLPDEPGGKLKNTEVGTPGTGVSGIAGRFLVFTTVINLPLCLIYKLIFIISGYA